MSKRARTKTRHPRTPEELLTRVIHACSEIAYPLGNEGALWLWGKAEFKDAFKALDERILAKDLPGGIQAGKRLVEIAQALVDKTTPEKEPSHV